MGLEECLDCGATVADSVGACPRCGSTANRTKRRTEQVVAAIEAPVIKPLWQLIRKPFWMFLFTFLFVGIVAALLAA